MIHRAGGETLYLEQAPYPHPTSPFWALVDWDYAYGGSAMQLIENKAGTLEIVGEGELPGVICHFSGWIAEASFTLFCFQDDRGVEFAVTRAGDRKLRISATGRSVSAEEFERAFRFPE